MTPADARRWAEANGKKPVYESVDGNGKAYWSVVDAFTGYAWGHPTEEQAWERIAKQLTPVYESFQRMDAAPVEGPYKPVKGSVAREPRICRVWQLFDCDSDDFMNREICGESLSRVIANELNRQHAASQPIPKKS